jgi:hypothetical protein
MFLDALKRWRQPEPNVRGEIEEVSPSHVAGWMIDNDDPARAPAFEVVCQRTGRVLAKGVADQYRHHLHWHDFGGQKRSFHARLNNAGAVMVRAAGGRAGLPLAEGCRRAYEPILHVAMDIVDNCNLRCPFCLYDYSQTKTTHFMTDAIFDSAMRLLPLTRDGQFWLSCLHEPTLHPDLMRLVDRVPADLRRKLMFTTNLAKRMPDAYYDWLANSGLYSINISIESRDPAIYERMRKGARHRIFMECWEKLLEAFARAERPPLIRYITMAYKSNLAELPELSRFLLEEAQAWRVELRDTFDMPYIPAEFRAAEFLDDAGWAQLRESLPAYPGDRLVLIAPPPKAAVDVAADAPQAPPPPPDVPAPERFLPDYYMISMRYDGAMRVTGSPVTNRPGRVIERDILNTHIDEVGEPGAFVQSLAGVLA